MITLTFAETAFESVTSALDQLTLEMQLGRSRAEQNARATDQDQSPA